MSGLSLLSFNTTPCFAMLYERRLGSVYAREEFIRDLERRNALKEARTVLHIRQELSHFFMGTGL